MNESMNYRILKDDELVFETPHQQEAWEVFDEQSEGTIQIFYKGTKLKERQFFNG